MATMSDIASLFSWPVRIDFQQDQQNLMIPPFYFQEFFKESFDFISHL